MRAQKGRSRRPMPYLFFSDASRPPPARRHEGDAFALLVDLLANPGRALGETRAQRLSQRIEIGQIVAIDDPAAMQAALADPFVERQADRGAVLEDLFFDLGDAVPVGGLRLATLLDPRTPCSSRRMVNGVGATEMRYQTKQPMKTTPMIVLTSIDAPSDSAIQKKITAAIATPTPVSQRLRTLTPGLTHCARDACATGSVLPWDGVSTCSIRAAFLVRVTRAR